MTESFPSEEKFILTSQIRRAALSISSNLAEGSSRKTPKDQSHFTTMAYSSLMELLNQLIIANDLCYLNDSELHHIRPEIELLSNKLNSFRNSQFNK